MGVSEVSATYAELSAVGADALSPGYMQTEVGVIPEDWEVTKLGIHATFKTGPFGSALHRSDYVYGGVPVINPMQIVDSKIVPTMSMATTEAAARKLSDFRLVEGDVVIGRRGDMGRCAFVCSEHDGWLCGTGSMIVRPKASLDARFIQRVLSSPAAISAIESASVGSTMINLNQGTLANLLVALPPTTAEQEAIAEALSDADALIESLERSIAKKRQIKQGAMHGLLTGQQRLPGFSDIWPIKPLGDLFEFSGGFAASRDQLGTEGHCYLHYGDIHTSSKSFVDVREEHQDIPKLNIPLKRVSPESLLAEGDVVFVDASEDDEGASKHVVILNTDGRPFISGLHTIVAKPKTEALAHDYLRHCFHTTAIKRQFRFFAVGTKVTGISKTNIAKITMPVPAIAEQVSIAVILSEMDAEIAELEIRLAKTCQIKQGMMQALLTGAIRLPLDKAA